LLIQVSFDYYLTDGGQQGTYAMFRAKTALSNTGTNLNSNDSAFIQLFGVEAFKKLITNFH
jgi:hypothetical protein